MKNKHKAGYYNENVNKDALNFLRTVLQERTQEVQQQQKNEILQKINDIEKQESQQTQPQKAVVAPVEEPIQKKSHLDPELVKSIEESILDSSPNVKWEDIQGLENVKKLLKETIVLPTIRPDLF